MQSDLDTVSESAWDCIFLAVRGRKIEDATQSLSAKVSHGLRSASCGFWEATENPVLPFHLEFKYSDQHRRHKPGCYTASDSPHHNQHKFSSHPTMAEFSRRLNTNRGGTICWPFLWIKGALFFFHSFHYRIKSMAFSLFIFLLDAMAPRMIMLWHGSINQYMCQSTRKKKLQCWCAKRVFPLLFAPTTAQSPTGRSVPGWVSCWQPWVRKLDWKTAQGSMAVNWLLFNHTSSWREFIALYGFLLLPWRRPLSGWPPSCFISYHNARFLRSDGNY